MSYDQEVRFEQGSDTGEDDAASIQPIAGSETYHSAVLNRQPSNLRSRTEVIREALKTLNYLSDYDRAVAISSTGTFKVRHVTTGLYSVIATEDLWLYPTLSPGKVSGGRSFGARLFVGDVEGLGTLGVNDLAVVAHRAHTGQRGYADGNDPGDGDTLTVGVNDVSVELVAESRSGGSGSVQVTITGTPRRHVRIAWGTTSGGTTLTQLISAVNADRTSQGSTGAADYVFLSTTSSGTSTTIPTCSKTVLRGGYDAEAHRVTAAQLASFFGTVANQLKDGEGLALGFAGPVEIGTSTQGGRRQSLHDLPTDKVGGFSDNTTPAIGHNLFNTGREPERIPGALPIGKMINGVFVFVDGTTLIAPTPTATDSRPIYLGESDATLNRLGSTSPGSTGADNIGFSSTATWHADSSDALASTDVQDALDEVVTDLAGSSGARHIGAETLAGSVTVGNKAASLTSGSVRQQLAQLLNTTASTSTGGGVNSRVSEFGHRLHGKLPLEKVMSESAPEALTSGGASMIRTVLNGSSTNSVSHATTDFVDESSLMQLTPVVYPTVYDDIDPMLVVSPAMTASEDIDRTSSANDQVRLSAGKWSVGTGQLPLVLALADTERHVVVKITGLTGSTDVDGYYYLTSASTVQLTLRRLDGSTPSFAGATLTSAKITIYAPVIIGSSSRGSVIRKTGGGGTLIKQYGFGYIVKSVDQDGTVKHEYNTDRGRWSIGNVYFSHNAERNTDNILILDDKNLLDGLETNAPVDATTNHHHGDNYTQVVENHTVLVNARALNTIASVSSPTVITAPYTPPTGYKMIGAHVLIYVTWKLASAASGDDISNEFYISNGLQAHMDISVKDKRPSVWASGEQFTRIHHGTIFVNASKQFSISFDDTFTKYTASASNVTITMVGAILARI